MDENWLYRCDYWRSECIDKSKQGKPKKRIQRPLLLAGHGINLRIDHGALLIRDGYTHHPQQRSEYRFFPGESKLPSRIILLDGSGSISFDVLDWLAQQKIPLVRINWQGDVITVTEPRATDPKKVREQLKIRENGDALNFSNSLIQQKIENSISTLTNVIPPSPVRKIGIDKLRREAGELIENPPTSVGALLGIEGRAAFAYFTAWQGIPITWKGIGRHPVPEAWHKIGPRQSQNQRKKGRNRHASHPVNAMLNYAYAVLESQVRIQIASEGYDSTLGFLHSYDRSESAFVFDLMEPLRPVIDLAVLQFVQSHTLHPDDFTIRNDGACRLNPEMVRQVVGIVSIALHDLSLSTSCRSMFENMSAPTGAL